MKECSYIYPSGKKCILPVFGTDKNTNLGYCKAHQYRRTDQKRRIKRKSLKERNFKLSRNKQDFDPFQWGYMSELEMFKDLWKNCDKKSQISGKDLLVFESDPKWINCFAHILSKKKYPLFRYNPNNILIIMPFEHYLIDHGTLKERIEYMEYYQDSDFNIFYDRLEELKLSYPTKKYFI